MGEVLALPGGYVANDPPGDALVNLYERIIARQAEIDSYLWGGPKGEGLIPSLARLESTVTKLAETVASVATRVSGEHGLGTEIRTVQDAVAALKTDLDEKHRVSTERSAHARSYLIAVTGTFGVPLAWLVYRSVQIALQGHL